MSNHSYNGGNGLLGSRKGSSSMKDLRMEDLKTKSE
jgi:hypothetical protein